MALRLGIGGLRLGAAAEAVADAYDPATEALLATGRYDAAPTTALKNLIDVTIKGLKADGVWAKGDCMYVRPVHESKLACQNWIKNAHNSTLHGATLPVFTAKQGFKGNGSSSYINNHYTPVTEAVNFGLTAMSCVVIYHLIPTTTGRMLLGANNNGATKYKFFIMFYTAGTERAYLNYVTTYNDAGNLTDGLHLGYTKNGTSTQAYQNGVAAGAAQVKLTDPALVDCSVFELCYSELNVGTSFNDGRIMFSWYGGFLSAAEMLALYNRIAYFIANVGATF
jgi:hypothetical protein